MNFTVFDGSDSPLFEAQHAQPLCWRRRMDRCGIGTGNNGLVR